MICITLSEVTESSVNPVTDYNNIKSSVTVVEIK